MESSKNLQNSKMKNNENETKKKEKNKNTDKKKYRRYKASGLNGKKQK